MEDQIVNQTVTKQESVERQYDVAVIGGGPAGAALATFLARKGRRCVIFEKSRFPRYHIGESLIPDTYGVLDRLGLLPKLRDSNYPVKHSVRFVPDNGKEPVPFYFSETIGGERARTWQVERSSFDLMMLRHAAEHGVAVYEETAVQNVIFDGDRAVGVSVTRDGEQMKRDVAARVVVDGSGHLTLLGKQLNLKKDVPGLCKGCVWGYWRGGKLWPGIDAGETTMFLVPGGGWFWYIPLPDDIVSVGIVADPSYLFGQGGQRVSDQEIYLREARGHERLWERLDHAQLVGPVRAGRRLAYFNSRTCGDGWVMIGDARAFLDPIYSSGLYLALTSAELAAGCVDVALAANDVSQVVLGGFEAQLMSGVDVIRRLIHAFYDPDFSFTEFLRRFPGQRTALIDCLVGDVLKDMSMFKRALAEMTPLPPPLN
jgi:flavin-dependent dehydrogenase